LSLKDEKLWELKEAAKWSLSIEERKKAISELVIKYGENALEALSEVKDTTVHEDVKKACIEAIMSAKKAKEEPSVKTGIPSAKNGNHQKAKNKHPFESKKKSKKERRR
jgi:hypothetical protein